MTLPSGCKQRGRRGRCRASRFFVLCHFFLLASSARTAFTYQSAMPRL